MKPWRARIRLWRAFRRADEGAAAVELAIFLPVILALVMGAVDFGRVVVAGIAVSNAVKAGVQFGAQNSAKAANVPDSMSIVAQADFKRHGTLTIDSVGRRCRCPGTPPTVYANCKSGGVVVMSCASGYGEPQEYVVMGARRTVNLFMRYPGWGASTVTTARVAILRVQ